MTAMQIVDDAFEAILRNWKAALKISLPVFFLNILVAGILGGDFWSLLLSGKANEAAAVLQSGEVRIMVLPLILLFFSIYWIAVAWHRFSLLKEPPGVLFPKVNFGRVLAYTWNIFRLGFVIGVAGILPLVLVASLFGEGHVNIGDYSQALARGPVAVIVNFLGTVIFAYPFLRYSPFLVAAAIGSPIMAGTARNATFWARKEILVISIGYAVVTLVTAVIGVGIDTGIRQINLLIVLLFQWIAFMFTISLLTTIYQLSVEKNRGSEIVENTTV